MVEKTANEATKGKKRFQVTNLMYLIITTVADVKDSIPDNVTASAYEGIKKGSAVMMNIPNPNPIVRWTKLAPVARRNIGILNSIFLYCHLIWSANLPFFSNISLRVE